MKATIFSAILLAAIAMAVIPVHAAETDSVILTTDSNCPDALVTGAAANEIGATVLVTARDELSSDAAAEIASIDPGTIYIVGGPAAVSDSVEEQLSSDYSVLRLWGVTRYGTAAEVALQFWESSPKAMLVWDALGVPASGNCELISEAKDLAMQEGIPVLLISRNSIPDQVVDALEQLGTSSVVLVGNVGSGVTGTLDTLGIEVDEQIKGTDVNGTRALLRQRIRENLMERAEDHMVVVAVGSWSDTIRAPFVPNGTSRLISSEGQIDALITEIQDGDYGEIDVVGKPDLAQAIYDRLSEAGIDARLVSGTPARVAAAVMSKQLERLRVRAAAVRQSLDNLCRSRATDAEGKVDALVSRVRNFINGTGLAQATKERWMNWVGEKKQAFDDDIGNGSYCMAWKEYSTMGQKITDLTFRYRDMMMSAYRNLVQNETRLTKAAENLREVAQSLKSRIAAARMDSEAS